MNTWIRAAGVVGAGMILGSAVAFGQFGGAETGGKPHATVKLLTSAEAVVPGASFDVGLHFRIDRGWHIYWKNGGIAGLPPTVDWTLPPGFTAAGLQFPVPKRYIDAAGLTSNIHAGEPVLLAVITPPATVAAKEVTLTAKGKYLICREKCLWEKIDTTVTLPVAAPGGKAKPANIALFTAARQVLPIQRSRFISIAPSLSTTELTPAATFDLLLAIEIAEGYYIHSPTPVSESFTKCDLFVEPAVDIYFDKPVYPKPRISKLPVLGNVSAYSGRVVIRVPGEVEEEELTGERPRFAGVLRYQACDDGGKCFPAEALAFSLDLDESGSPVMTTAAPQRIDDMEAATSTADGKLSGFLGRLGLLGLLIGCFLYGLILNATPCVLPLLSIKVLGFVRQAHESRRRTLLLGLAFGAGVILFFVALGLLASAGRNLLQYPAVIIALGAVIMAFALSTLGVYTLQAPSAATTLEAAIRQEGLLSSFGKGALAPLLGFACTGPLMAAAFGWATQQPPLIAIVSFFFAGVGMASPYMLLGANPKWLSFLPKPGPWLITFERIMGFLLLAMVIWLLNPLVTQIGPAGLQWTLGFFVAIAMACWLIGRVDVTMPTGRRWRYRGGATAIVVISGVLIFGWIHPLGEAQARVRAARLAWHSGSDDASSGIRWQPWSPEAVKAAVASGNTVLVDFTAAWCTVCKVNKVVAIDTPEVLAKMTSLGVVSFQADFTSPDPKIAAAMREHGRAGPPLNVIYPAGKFDEPIVLRPQLTKKYLLEKLDDAGPSRVATVAERG